MDLNIRKITNHPPSPVGKIFYLKKYAFLIKLYDLRQRKTSETHTHH